MMVVYVLDLPYLSLYIYWYLGDQTIQFLSMQAIVLYTFLLNSVTLTDLSLSPTDLPLSRIIRFIFLGLCCMAFPSCSMPLFEFLNPFFSVHDLF